MDKELHLSFGSHTDAGLLKEFNTDAVSEFVILDGQVFVVCDGHDGESGHGALAARLLADSIKKYFYNRSYKDMVKALTNAITFANLALYEQSQKDEKYNGIASTLAILIYHSGHLYYAYAGDSRIYIYRNNQLQLLTRDHVADPLNAIGADVTVLIGKSKDIKFGVCKNPLNVLEDDTFMLCTDGLSDQLTEADIAEVIGDGDKAPEHKCKNLIELANEKGGIDCASVQIIEFSRVIELQKPKGEIYFKPILLIALGIIALVALGFGGFKGYEAFKNRPEKEQMVDEPKVDEPEVQEKKKIKKQAPVAKKEMANEKVEKKTPKTDQPEESKSEVTEKKINTNENINIGGKVYYSHEIKQGENLYRIAIRYNVTQKQLIEINGKKAESLVSGSNLKIPVKAIHKVVNSESFSSISNKYNVKIKLICNASGIDEGSALKEGEVLVIPLSK